jgi:hypothetical protein
MKGQTMNKKLAIVLIVIAFVAGIIAGGLAYRHYAGRAFEQFNAIMATFHAEGTVDTLKLLRSNDITNSIEGLEMELDENLAVLNQTVDYLPEPARDEELKVLQKAKAYRAKFPRKTQSPEIDQAVSNVLSRVEVSNNK